MHRIDRLIILKLLKVLMRQKDACLARLSRSSRKVESLQTSSMALVIKQVYLESIKCYRSCIHRASIRIGCVCMSAADYLYKLWHGICWSSMPHSLVPLYSFRIVLLSAAGVAFCSFYCPSVNIRRQISPHLERQIWLDSRRSPFDSISRAAHK